MTSPAPSAQRLPALDGVRGLAIAGVLLTHARPSYLSPGIRDWFDSGAFGVDLFFVLSGFLITGILLDSRESLHYYGRFYGRRFLRLFPVYYSYLLVLAVVLPAAHRLLAASIPDYQGNWWWYILYFCNWKSDHAVGDPFLGHFWSLAIEEQFYIVWPSVVLLLPRRRLVWICATLAAVSFGLRCVWSMQSVDWNTVYRVTVCRLEPMLLGSLAAIAVRSQVWRPRVAASAPWLAAAGIAGWIGIGIACGAPLWIYRPVQTVGALAAAFGFAGLTLFAATRSSGWGFKFLSARLFTELGKYSYCMYVIHLVIIQHMQWLTAYFANRSPSNAIAFATIGSVASILLTFWIARLSWNWFESPLMTKGRLWLEDRFTPRLAATTSS